MKSMYCMVCISVPIGKSAKMLAKGLVNKRLAACVNVIPSMSSHYWWEGKLSIDRETLLMIKTRTKLLPELIKFVSKHHPYTVPEIIALPIMEGNKPYLKWLSKETSH